MFTKVLVSAAMTLSFFAVGAAPTNAEPELSEPHTSPFGSLTCDCQGVPPAKGPGAADLDRGILTALSGQVDHPRDK
ncbi:hypothetical protein MKUB_25980 [Mycobacterium kubicae]|uniref:Secreted protein n=1 Tax=Mycobacterium kubicae TaxID=120959 RepID=A0AAX1JIZ2_9MYCO|nr:hypothetical protein [Mycobacterium kubicae]MCV7095965.1 hypothetical protein [Mycobacterium kubicae]ORV99344.1 hypothetical protein AWC13_11410 [Mycobacterium kubicae]QNI07126.1 hypothetical protein GAN17_13130 [Mycobacterium kubicae]QNI12133.1 hypothetical protein GAN18_13770 [Mycobacterium kubicae]QPI40362.1 hypothetical protein I2456_13575 [Mycobacterium kubicae]